VTRTNLLYISHLGNQSFLQKFTKSKEQAESKAEQVQFDENPCLICHTLLSLSLSLSLSLFLEDSCEKNRLDIFSSNQSCLQSSQKVRTEPEQMQFNENSCLICHTNSNPHVHVQ